MKQLERIDVSKLKLDPKQSYFLKNFSFCYVDKEGPFGGYAINSETNQITIIQNEDITKTIYLLKITSEFSFAVSKKVKNKWSEQTKFGCEQVVLLDFNDQVSKIKIFLEDDWCEPFTLSIIYVKSDEKAWYAKLKKEEEAKKALLLEERRKEMGLKVRDGVGLLNVFFNILSDKVKKIKICLYWNDNGVKTLVQSHELLPPQNFLPILNLGFGGWTIEVIQYDKNGDVFACDERYSVVRFLGGR